MHAMDLSDAHLLLYTASTDKQVSEPWPSSKLQRNNYDTNDQKIHRSVQKHLVVAYDGS